MSTFLISLQDQGKTNVALKFNKEDGILKYYNDFGDFSCFVQTEPSVYLDVCLITNKGTLINHETHIGKGKKKEGSVFQTNPIIIQTDNNGKCNFRCHVYTSCQNCKCLFFIVKVSYRLNDKLYSFVSSPFVGATKDPHQTMVGGPQMSYLSSMSYEDFMKNHQLTTLIVYKNPNQAVAMSHINRSDTPPPPPSKRKGHAPTSSTIVDTEPLNFVIHQVTSSDEVLSYYKDINNTSALEELMTDSKPNATYKLSKARSLSHQSADSIEINKETNYNYLEKRAKIFVNQLINWEKRGQIHALERDQILRDAVRQFDFYLKQELTVQLASLSQQQATLIHAASLQNRDSTLLMQAKTSGFDAYGSPYLSSVSAAAASAASLNNQGATDPIEHDMLNFPFSGYTTSATTVSSGGGIGSSSSSTRLLTGGVATGEDGVSAQSPAVAVAVDVASLNASATDSAHAASLPYALGKNKGKVNHSAFDEINFGPLLSYPPQFATSRLSYVDTALAANNSEGLLLTNPLTLHHGVTPEDFKDLLSDTSTTVSGAAGVPNGHKQSSGSGSSQYKNDGSDDEEIMRETGSINPGFSSYNEFKTAATVAAASAAGFYRPVFQVEAIQNTLACFMNNKAAVFSSTHHASLAKSMALRIKRDNDSLSLSGGATNGLPINMEDYTHPTGDSPSTKRSRAIEFESMYLPKDENVTVTAAALAASVSSSSASVGPGLTTSRRSTTSTSSSNGINAPAAVSSGKSSGKSNGGPGQTCDDAAMVLMSLQKKKK